MQFTCSVSDLSSALSVVTRAIAARSTIAIMEGVLLTADQDHLYLTCADISMGIKTHIEATIQEQGSVVLPGKLFAEIVRKLPSDEPITLSVDDKNIAKVRCNSSRTTLTGLSADEFPPLPEIEDAKEIIIPEVTLREMIQKTTFAIATDETRPILTGALLESEAHHFSVIALDGFRLALRRHAFGSELPELSLVVPGKALNEIARILNDSDDSITIRYGKTHLIVDMESTRFVARLLEGEFIRYRQILPQEWQTRVTVKKKLLEEAIDRASLMAREGKNNLVKMHIEENLLLITSNAELGDVREEIAVVTEGRELDIAFNVRYISDTLRAIEEESITLRFNSNVSPCVICPEAGDHFLYLALPVRVFSA